MTGSTGTDDYLGVGIAGQLRDQLSGIPELRVVARASSDRFDPGDSAMSIVGEQLDAELLVTGSVERNGSQLLVSVELVEAKTGTRVWNAEFAGNADDLLSLQQRLFDDIAAQVAEEPASRPGATALPTARESAYSRLLVANRYYQQVLDQPVVDRDLLDDAIAAYRDAVAEDPESPMLNSRLAAALLFDGQVDEAGQWVRQAMSLEGAQQSSHVQHTLGLYLYARSDDGVGQHLARAVELNPNNVDALADYGMFLYAQADVAGARENLERALSIDSRSLVRYEQLGTIYSTAGFYDDAVALVRRIEEEFDTAEALLSIAQTYERLGDLDIAIAWVIRARLRNPGAQSTNWKLAELFARLDDPDAARQFDPSPSVATLYFSRDYRSLIEVITENNAFGYYSPDLLFTLARAYMALDRPELAVRLLTHYELPERLQRDSATTSELEASVVLADALKQSGQLTESRQLAERMRHYFGQFVDAQPDSWHPYINLACLHSISGNPDLALDTLDEMMSRRGLPWYPRVSDAPCFRIALADMPRYRQVLDQLRQRKQELRRRLPQTLAAHGLDPSVHLPGIRMLSTP